MGYGKQRKLTAMALANLLSTGHPQIVQRVQNILPILSSVLIEMRDLDADQCVTQNAKMVFVFAHFFAIFAYQQKPLPNFVQIADIHL